MAFRRLLLILLLCYTPLSVQGAYASDPSVPSPEETFLLTVFLKHDQSKTLDELQSELNAKEFWAKFPPEGIEVVSWYVMMGVGQVVTLSVPPSRLREVNRVIEQTAWGSFRTEFYATYDLSEVAEDFRAKALSEK